MSREALEDSVVMATNTRGIQEEIRIGDVVQTVMGAGVVTQISNPMREGDYPIIEVDLGQKWMTMNQVQSVVRYALAVG
jgi:hypothetical protein